MLSVYDQNECLYFQHFKAGKEGGFTFFYKLYYPRLYRFGQRYIEHTGVVEEVLHDAFLDTWELKHLIECPRHLYCFIRLRLKWGCFKYFKQRQKEKLVCYGDIDESFGDDSFQDKLYNDNRELLNLIYKALPLLPPTKENIMNLYFRYGMSYKEIARHYSVSNQRISRQLHDSIHFLKTLIKKKKKVDTVQIVSTKIKDLEQMEQSPTGELLKDEQLELFKLRYEKKYSFDRIAYELGIDITEVQQKYVAAHRLLNTTRHKKQYSYG